MAKPEMTMFYVIKAVNLHCGDGDCIFCEYHDFCKQVCMAVQYLRLHFPDDYNRLYNIVKEGKKNNRPLDTSERGVGGSVKNSITQDDSPIGGFHDD